MLIYSFVALKCRVTWSDFSTLLIRYLDLQTMCWSTSHMRAPALHSRFRARLEALRMFYART